MQALGTVTNVVGNTAQITGISPYPSGIAVGSAANTVYNSQTFPSGVTITAYSVSAGSMTVQGTVGPISNPMQLYFGGSNGGTTILDSAGNCFLRVTSNYSQKEWGALSDGDPTFDDQPFLQAWMYANQPHIAVAGTSFIAEPLYCGVNSSLAAITDGGVIQGPPPSAVSGAGVQPAFLIEASDTNSSGRLNPNLTAAGAMLVLGRSQCGVSALGIMGNNNTALQVSGNHYNLINGLAANNSVLNHSQLFGGYNGLDCTSPNANYNVTVLDSSVVQQANDSINAPSSCTKIRIERSVISNPHNDGIVLGGVQALIENNVIEQSLGDGLACTGGQQLAVNGNYFDNNGKGVANTYNFHATGCNVISIAGNQFHRSSGASENTGVSTAQIWFDGQNDTVSLAGNVNLTDNDSNQLAMRPDYDLELGPTAIITNFSYADAPTPQNNVTTAFNGIFGPRAMATLSPVFQPVQPNYLTGLSTQAAANTANLSIQGGSAADSQNVQLITLSGAASPSPCPVALGQNGLNGLDINSVQAPAQYNFYAIAQGGYASQSSCIATLQPTGTSVLATPNFAGTKAQNSTPAYSVALTAFVSANSNLIANVTLGNCSPSCTGQNPFGGIDVGDTVTDLDGCIPTWQTGPPTTIQSLASINASFSGTVATGSPSVTNITSLGAGQTLQVGEQVGSSSGYIPPNSSNNNNTYITAVSYDGNGNIIGITLSQNSTGGGQHGQVVPFTASGVHTIQLNAAASSSCSSTWNSPDTIYVWNDRYRLVASLFTTTSGSGTVLAPYTQNGNTFYLSSPTSFSASVQPAIGGTAVSLPVPKGLAVEAFGRCVASARVYLFNWQQTALPAENFPFSPGYDTQLTTSPDTSFPFRIYTNTTGQIYGMSQSGTATLQCMLDGWNLPRGP
jgi:YD repeat-containing protein